MKSLTLAVVAAAVAGSAVGQEHRELGAHLHGVGHLAVAFEGRAVLMQLVVPGADIVGFEHAATSTEERAAVDAAVAMLARPLDLFVLPAGAGCSVSRASAELEIEGAAGGQHTEFHAEYELDCADPGAVERIEFAYFARFPNAQEIEVELVTSRGARAFEVVRGTPVLDLRGQI